MGRLDSVAVGKNKYVKSCCQGITMRYRDAKVSLRSCTAPWGSIGHSHVITVTIETASGMAVGVRTMQVTLLDGVGGQVGQQAVDTCSVILCFS